MKRVRMLTDYKVEGLAYRCGQVVDFPASIAKDLINLAAADGSKDAVAFAMDENAGKVLVHESEALRAAELELASLQGQDDALRAAYNAEKDAAARAEIAKQGDELAQKLDAAKAALDELKAE